MSANSPANRNQYAETLAAQRAHANDPTFMDWLRGRLAASNAKSDADVLLFSDAPAKFPELAD